MKKYIHNNKYLPIIITDIERGFISKNNYKSDSITVTDPGFVLRRGDTLVHVKNEIVNRLSVDAVTSIDDLFESYYILYVRSYSSNLGWSTLSEIIQPGDELKLIVENNFSSFYDR